MVSSSESEDGMSIVTMDMESYIRRALDLFAASGRRRVGMLTMQSNSPEYLCEPQFELGGRGLRTSPRWTCAVDPYHTKWVIHALRSILDRPRASERPDALLITDDHLVEPAAEAMRELGVRVPEDLLVAGHWNFPLPYRGPLPIRLIGYDARIQLHGMIEVIDAMRSQTPAPAIPPRVLPALFEDEIARTEHFVS
jgi:DNA-binding LacI/PurR family transcriptional regulator